MIKSKEREPNAEKQRPCGRCTCPGFHTDPAACSASGPRLTSEPPGSELLRSAGPAPQLCSHRPRGDSGVRNY